MGSLLFCQKKKKKPNKTGFPWHGTSLFLFSPVLPSLICFLLLVFPLNVPVENSSFVLFHGGQIRVEITVFSIYIYIGFLYYTLDFFFPRTITMMEGAASAA
jgi:hypothetical protein